MNDYNVLECKETSIPSFKYIFLIDMLSFVIDIHDNAKREFRNSAEDGPHENRKLLKIILYISYKY